MKSLLLLVLVLVSATLAKADFEVVFTYPAGDLEFQWPNRTFQALYQDLSAQVIGVKAYKDDLYFSLPRWRGNSHPVNLGTLPKPQGLEGRRRTSPKIEPFPSLEFQKVGDCSAVQNGFGFEIDPASGLMWIPDVGRQLFFFESDEDRARRDGEESEPCQPKLVILDLNTGKVVRTHMFPEEVVRRRTSFLNDIALDVTDPDNVFAYISDALDNAIIVYSFAQDKSWRVEHDSMKPDPKFVAIPLEGHDTVEFSIGIDGIAFSPGAEGGPKVYYCPISSLSIFEVPSDCLRNEKLANDTEYIARVIKEYAGKPSQNDGITADNRSNLYLTEVATNSVSKWTPRNDSFEASRTVLAQDATQMVWPDTLTIDDGYLYFSTWGWPFHTLNNIVRVKVDEESYLKL